VLEAKQNGGRLGGVDAMECITQTSLRSHLAGCDVPALSFPTMITLRVDSQHSLSHRNTVR